MTGYIKITAAIRDGHQGLEVKTDVQDVSLMDCMQVLDSLCRSFKIGLSELGLFMALKNAGILDKTATVQDELVKGTGADLLS